MAKPHPFFLLLCLLCLRLDASASTLFSPTLTNAYQELLKLRVANSRALLRNYTPSTQDEKAATLLFNNYNDFLELSIGQDQKRYDHLLEAQEKRLASLSKLSKRSAWTDYATAEISMQTGISELLFGNRLAAAWDIRKAYLQYVANEKRWPHFVPNRKNLGALQVMLGSVPDQYQWFLNIIGLKGSVQKGMVNLEAAATTINPFQNEAKLLQAIVLHALEQDKADQAISQLLALSGAQPDNLLFRFGAMHLLKKTNKGEAALRLYEARPTSNSYLSFPFLRHMAADLYLYRGDYEKSAYENKLFLQQHPGRHYLKSAHLKLYMAYLLNNEPAKAKWYYKQISAVGIRETEEDRYAASYVAQTNAPLLPLLKSRLHADGGYYQQALQDLAKPLAPADSSLAVRAEYLYRKARIYHGLEDIQKATALYKQTIALAGHSDLYFAPNASLQLGYIYQQSNQPEKAKGYFRQALSYKNHAYKNSIDAKAKLALSSF